MRVSLCGSLSRCVAVRAIGLLTRVGGVAPRDVPMRMSKWNNGRLGPHPARHSDTTLATLWIQFFN